MKKILAVILSLAFVAAFIFLSVDVFGSFQPSHIIDLLASTAGVGAPLSFAMANLAVPSRNNTFGTTPGRNNVGQNYGAVQARSVVSPGVRHIFQNPAAIQSANMMPIPDSISVTVTSTLGVGAVPTRVYLFNQDILNNVTDNTSGPGSIAYTYSDGFAGNLISALLAQDRYAMGSVCFGVSLRMIDGATGTGDPAGLASSNPSFLTNTAFGNALPLNFNNSSNQTRQDQDTSIEVIPCIQNVGRFVQYSFVANASAAITGITTATFYFTPNYIV